MDVRGLTFKTTRKQQKQPICASAERKWCKLCLFLSIRSDFSVLFFQRLTPGGVLRANNAADEPEVRPTEEHQQSPSLGAFASFHPLPFSAPVRRLQQQGKLLFPGKYSVLIKTENISLTGWMATDDISASCMFFRVLWRIQPVRPRCAWKQLGEMLVGRYEQLQSSEVQTASGGCSSHLALSEGQGFSSFTLISVVQMLGTYLSL